MGKYVIEDTSLVNIAAAIRAKTGDTATITVADMPTAIAAITTGSGGGAEIPDIVITGDGNYAFNNGHWDWVMEDYPDKITTKNLTSISNMFQGSKVKTIPIVLNGSTNSGSYCATYSAFANMPNLTEITEENLSGLQGQIYDLDQAFVYDSKLTSVPAITFSTNPDPTGNGHSTNQAFFGCQNLTSIGDFTNFQSNSLNSMFEGCWKLKQLPNFINYDFSNYGVKGMQGMFADCHSLRSIPGDFLKEIMSNVNQDWYTESVYSYLFKACYCLDEITNMGVSVGWQWYYDNFIGAFDGCYRVKEVTFATNNGTPYVAEWANQVIDLTNYVGYAPDTNFNSNYGYGKPEITYPDDWVKDSTTYNNAIANNNNDWFTTSVYYSRYNHDSAVNTINSLPDTSAFAAENGTNTIKFTRLSGRDAGGMISGLSGAEIAVATAKGWTVTLQ